MLQSINKKGLLLTLMLVVIIINTLLQSFATDHTAQSSEEEKTLASIRAMRLELQRLHTAEQLLHTDPKNFAHPIVLSSLRITDPGIESSGESSGESVEEMLEQSLSQSLSLSLAPQDKSSIDLKPRDPPIAPLPPVSTNPVDSSSKVIVSDATGPTYDLISALSTSAVISKDNVLVVGGTDGSGTRRVVQLLTKLGVTVVSEDPETYDIHADLFGGWPNVVTPVLTSSGSIVADPTTYPKRLQNDISNSLKRLIQKATTDAKKPQSFRLAVGGALDKPSGTHSSRVKFAFKAPVAMTLVPWWLQVTDKLMFLHVIRDGRDIAFSANQGPVNKFYAPMYGKRITQVPTGAIPDKAIKLWADWNNGLRQWAESKMRSLSRGQQFDYLQTHIEDLVHSSVEVRLNAIVRVANFVGSDLDDDSLCCLAMEGSSFMGSHDRAGKIGTSGEATLKSKYGKWKAKFKADPNVEKSLMKWGKEALSDLGYLEMDDLTAQVTAEFKERMKGKYQCTLSKIQCLAKAQGIKEWRHAEEQRYTPTDSSVAKLCSFRNGVDFRGGKNMQVDLSSISVKTPDECCRRCRSTGGCKFFTFVQQSDMCYLKRQSGTEISDETTFNLVSGATLA